MLLENHSQRCISCYEFWEKRHQPIGLPWLTEISVTRGSELTVLFRLFQLSVRFGSGLYFCYNKRCWNRHSVTILLFFYVCRWNNIQIYIMSTCFGCEIQTVYSCLNRTEITENRHQKLKPNRKKSETLWTKNLLMYTLYYTMDYGGSISNRRGQFLIGM